MSRYAEYEALSAVGSAYGRWVDANTGLDVAMDAAAAQGAAPPVAALKADFEAGLEVTRAVIAFARACPPSGPHVDDLPNGAFVQAMFQAVTPQLAGEVDDLVRAWADWLPVVGRWTPASTEMPPRPLSAAHSHVLAAVDAWREADQEALRGRLVDMLTEAGGERTGTSFTIRDDGELVERTLIEFRPLTKESDDPPREPAGRLRRLLRGRRDR